LSKPIVFSYEKGYRYDKNGWTYIHVEGEPYGRGLQHGYLLAQEIEEIMRVLKHITYWNTGKTWDFFVKEGEKQFACKIDGEFLDEICGIADGAKKAGTKVTWQEIITWNGYRELLYYWWPFNENGKSSEINNLSSAFIATGAATKDGKIVLAHNTCERFETGQFLNVIMDLMPSRGHRVLMQTAPGYIHSYSNFFVTSRGLMGADTTIRKINKYDVNGSPDFFRIRKAMQYADNMSSFVEIMKNKSNGAYCWLLGDINTNEIMKFEQGYEYSNIKIIKDGYFQSLNAPEDPRIRNHECSCPSYLDIRHHQGAGRVRLKDLVKKHYGKLDTEISKLILADHYDVYLKKFSPSSRTIDRHYELDDFKYSNPSDSFLPFQPAGTLDGKVIDSGLAKDLSFYGRWGNSSGLSFNTEKYFLEHNQWNHLKGYLKNRVTEPWTIFETKSNHKE